MKNTFLSGLLLCLALFSSACKSDKKADTNTSDDAGQTSAAKTESPAFREATLQEFIGDFADENYPDKGFWKKFTVKFLAGESVEVSFTSSGAATNSPAPACSFKGIGVFSNGYIRTPVNPDSADPTYLTIHYMVNGDIFVGAEGGGQENPSEVLTLFCFTSTPTSLGGLYKKLN